MNKVFFNYKSKKVFDKKGNILGEIHGIVFDIDFEKVLGFSYKKNFLKTRFFLINEVFLEDDDKIVLSKIHREKKYFYELIGKQVRDEENNIIGFISDIEFDITYKLKNIIIDSGYNLSSIEIHSPTKISVKKNYLNIDKKSILSYEKDYIIVEIKNKIKENKKTLENISKIFINIQNPSYNINIK